MRQRTEKEINVRKAYIDGFRPFVVYHPVGIYKGCFRKSQLHGYGIKVYPSKNLVYDGEWRDSKCHGTGTLRKINKDGTSKRIYVGQWNNGRRCGEGKMFHNNWVYYGWWRDNKPHGKGIKWYKNKEIYIGEWEYGRYNGAGVLFYANGDRYEGLFSNGVKNGEGLYFHNSTGQVQKGVWYNDFCKTSLMFDEFRPKVIRPTPYPIQENKLFNPDQLVKELFRDYLPKLNPKKKSTFSCLDFLTKMRMKFMDILA